MQAVVITITDDPTLIATGTGDANFPTAVALKVPTAAETLYLGGADVDTTDGYPVAAEGEITVNLRPGQALYGVVQTGPLPINTLVR